MNFANPLIPYDPNAPVEETPRSRRRKAVMMGELLMRQGSDTSPAPSKAAGLARLAAGIAGGIFSRIEDDKEAARQKQLSDLTMAALGGGSAPAGGIPPTAGTTPAPASGFNTSGKLPTFASMPVSQNLKPHETALLNAIAAPESGGRYDIRYTPSGGATFAGYDQHPAIYEPGPEGRSSAAGRYQFVKSTWDRMGGGAFTPEAQDQRALQLARQDYGRRTGRDLDADLTTNGFTPAIASALSPTWAGFKANPSKAAAAYQSTLGKLSDASAAPMPNAALPETRPAYEQPLPSEPGWVGPKPSYSTREALERASQKVAANEVDAANMPMANASEAGLLIPTAGAGNTGFVMPPASSAAPAGPPMPPAMENLSPAEPSGPILRDTPLGLNSLLPADAQPAAPDIPVAPVALDAGQRLAASPAPAPLDPRQDLSGTPWDVPLPPSRPAGLDAAPAAPTTASVAASAAQAVAPPLPPARPDFASAPAAADPRRLAAALSDPRLDYSNSNDAGAGAFARGGMTASPQALAAALTAPGSRSDPQTTGSIPTASAPSGGTPAGVPAGYGLSGLPGAPMYVSNPIGGGGAPAPAAAPGTAATMTAPATSAGAPTSIIPPGASGGPAAGPNGPVAAPAQAQAVPSSDARNMALRALVAHPDADSATRMWALGQLNPKNDYGFTTLPDGTVLRTDPRSGSVSPVYTAPKPPTYGVIGTDSYGNSQYGFIDPSTRQVQPTGPQNGGQVLPGQPGSVIAAPPPGVDPKVWREGQSKAATADALPVDPTKVSELRREVLGLPSYKNMTQAMPVYSAMADAAGRDKKAADLNLIYGLGKIMDPGSVVREGEMALANGTSGLDERLKGFANSIFGGARLTPETRATLLAEAYGRMRSYEGAFSADTKHYQGIAKRGRMNIEDVIPAYEPAKPWTPPAAASGAAPPVGAVQALRSNPRLQADFDAKYGQGAAARALGGG